jgi:anti-sigma factor RsiW
LAPLYWSGELEAQAMAEVEQHLKECPACAREMAAQKQCDEMLQEALLSQPVQDEEVRRRVRAEIQQPAPRWSPNRWWLALGTAAAMFLFAAIRFVYLPSASHSTSTTGQVPVSIWADAADDHNEEVVKREPRKWLSGAAEINALVAEKTGDAKLVAELAPEHYHIDRMRICELAMRTYIHLVYTDGRHEISFFLRRRGGEQLTGPKLAEANGRAVEGESVEKLQIAGFQSQRYTVLVVSQQPRQQTIDFACHAADSVLDVAAISVHNPLIPAVLLLH